MKRSVLLWFVVLSAPLLCFLTSFSQTHYEPVPGKTVGLWPDAWTVERMAYLRTRYGFSGVFVPVDQTAYNNAIAAGFLPSQVMVSTSGDNYIYAVDNLPAGIYYLDEPTEHNCLGEPTASRLYTPQELAARRDYIHLNRPGSLFVIGGYKRCSHNLIASTYADLMMFSSYKNWDEVGLPVCFINLGWGDQIENLWIPGSEDQRGSWSAMRQALGNRYMITWIHGGGDEYNDLFGHANNLGLNGIWQYNGAPIDSARLETFCFAAWQNGWMQKVNDPPLPVQLSSFTAIPLGSNDVRLAWVTVSELNNYGFEVQRRHAENSDFVSLTFVPGHGTTNVPHEYSFTDLNVPSPRLWYRLKQIDFDGTASYSDVISVDVLTEVDGDIVPTEFSLEQNFPNPFNPVTTFQFSISTSQFTVLKVYDLIGLEVATLVNEQKPTGTYSVRWDASGVASGVYLYKLRAGTFVQTKKLVLLR